MEFALVQVVLAAHRGQAAPPQVAVLAVRRVPMVQVEPRAKAALAALAVRREKAERRVQVVPRQVRVLVELMEFLVEAIH